MTNERNYLVEAIEIIDGDSLMLAERKHLMALWEMLTRRQQEMIREEAVEEEAENYEGDSCQ